MIFSLHANMVSEQSSGRSMTSTSITSISSSSQSTIAFNHPLAVKLDPMNFLLWKQQCIAAIRGHRLMHFLLDSNSAPHKFDSEGRLLQDFVLWDAKDQLLLGWLLGSVSNEFLSDLVGCSTSFLVWQKINQLFASRTKPNVSHYRNELQSLKKNGLTMSVSSEA